MKIKKGNLPNVILEEFNKTIDQYKTQEAACVLKDTPSIVTKAGLINNGKDFRFEGVCVYCGETISKVFYGKTRVYSYLYPEKCPSCNRGIGIWKTIDEIFDKKLVTVIQLPDKSQVFVSYKIEYKIAVFNSKQPCDIFDVKRTVEHAIRWDGKERLLFRINKNKELKISSANLNYCGLWVKKDSFVNTGFKEFVGIDVENSSCFLDSVLHATDKLSRQVPVDKRSGIQFEWDDVPYKTLMPFSFNVLNVDNKSMRYDFEFYCAHCGYTWQEQKHIYNDYIITCPNCSFKDEAFRHHTSYISNKLNSPSKKYLTRIAQVKDRAKSIDIIFLEYSIDGDAYKVSSHPSHAVRISKKNFDVKRYVPDVNNITKWVTDKDKYGQPNFTMLFVDETLKESRIKELFDNKIIRDSGFYNFVPYYLALWLQNPTISKIVDRERLFAYFVKQISASGMSPYMKIDIAQDNIPAMFYVSEELLNFFENNEYSLEFAQIQEYYRFAPELTGEMLEWYASKESNVFGSAISLKRHNISLRETFEYLERIRLEECVQPRNAIVVWKEYIYTADREGLDITDKNIRFPKNLYTQYHIIVNSSAKHFTKRHEDIYLRKIEPYKNFNIPIDGFIIKVPQTINELLEGRRLLGHENSSLYSNTLFDSDRTPENAIILFVYKSNDIDSPVAAIGATKHNIFWFSKRYSGGKAKTYYYEPLEMNISNIKNYLKTL